MKPDHVGETEAAIAAIASKATFAGAGTTIFGWLLSSEGAVFTGIVLGLAGIGVNYWFQRRRDEREERELAMRLREHQARMELLEHRGEDVPTISPPTIGPR